MKILRSLPKKWKTKVIAIQEANKQQKGEDKKKKSITLKTTTKEKKIKLKKKNKVKKIKT